MRWSRLLPASASAVALALAAAPLAAQAPAATAAVASLAPTLDGKLPKRPKLDAGADTNDARVVYNWSLSRDVPWKEKYNAAYWAFRLEPGNEAYLYAMQQALWNTQSPDWRWEFWMGAEYVLKSKEAKVIDSLLTLAYTREPFVHLYASECRIPEWVLDLDDPREAGDVYYDRGCNRQAAAKYDTALKKNPRLLSVRMNRARALYWLKEHGNALAELQTAIDTLRARDTKRTTRRYLSKEVLEYMRGEILEDMQDYNAARQAYGRALEENLAYYQAHARLARIALVQGETDLALQEYDQALQLFEPDPVVHLDYGFALLRARRHADAEREFRRAIALEPYYALAYYNLAVALDNQGRKDEALAGYRDYLARAPRRDARFINHSNARVAALSAAQPVTAAPKSTSTP